MNFKVFLLIFVLPIFLSKYPPIFTDISYISVKSKYRYIRNYRYFVPWSHKGLGVPSIALLLDFFSMKESVEGFLYIAKRSNAKLIISDLPSSHKHWKERYFFVGGHNWEYNSAD